MSDNYVCICGHTSFGHWSDGQCSQFGCNCKSLKCTDTQPKENELLIENARLKKAVDDAKKIIIECEWAGVFYESPFLDDERGEIICCPLCYSEEGNEHEKNCELHAWLIDYFEVKK